MKTLTETLNETLENTLQIEIAKKYRDIHNFSQIVKIIEALKEYINIIEF